MLADVITVDLDGEASHPALLIARDRLHPRLGDRVEVLDLMKPVIENALGVRRLCGGRVLRVEVDSDNDGAADQAAIYTYDERGFLIAVEGDIGADGSIDNRTTYTRDDRGDALTEDYDGDADGALESRTTYTYDCWPE